MMETILGKMRILFFALHSIALCGAADSLLIKLFDTQHEEVKEVAIGQPFVVEVILKGNMASQGQPIFENLERINGHRSGYQMNSINGDTTIIYSYKARVDQEGTYVVGPVRVGHYQTDVLTVIAGKTIQQARNNKIKKQKVLLQFFTNAHDVVVGEKIQCRLRFLYTDDSVTLKNIGHQELPGFDQSSIQGPISGTETVHGTLFNYAEWRWYVTANKEGNYLIPAYYADYVLKKNRHNFWGNFAHLFDEHDMKRVYANAEKITVHALDDAPYSVCAVGKNIKIKASVDTAVVRQSEGIALSIEVVGDEDACPREIKSLTGIPEELRWYRSKGSKIGSGAQRSEFIIQGLKHGDYEIPAQLLCYFDPELREYKTVATEPITVSIIPLRDPLHGDVVEKEKELLQEDDERSTTENQLPLSQSRWYGVAQRGPLSWWLFACITLLLMIGIMVKSIIFLWQQFFYNKADRKEYTHAFVHALQAVKMAQREHNAQTLYAIFASLLSIRCGLSEENVSQEQLEYEFNERCTDDALKERWKYFLDTLAKAAFGYGASDDDRLFVSAIEWIDNLKKIV